MLRGFCILRIQDDGRLGGGGGGGGQGQVYFKAYVVLNRARDPNIMYVYVIYGSGI